MKNEIPLFTFSFSIAFDVGRASKRTTARPYMVSIFSLLLLVSERKCSED